MVFDGCPGREKNSVAFQQEGCALTQIVARGGSTHRSACSASLAMYTRSSREVIVAFFWFREAGGRAGKEECVGVSWRAPTEEGRGVFS